MTIEELKELNLPIEANDSTVLYVGAALDWLLNNTTLYFDKKSIDSIKTLPDGAKVFICRYFDVLGVNTAGVVSESIGGMSQSYDTKTKNALLYQYASELLGSYLKGQVSSVPNVSNWQTGKVASGKQAGNVLYDETTGRPYRLTVNNEKLYLDEVYVGR